MKIALLAILLALVVTPAISRAAKPETFGDKACAQARVTARVDKIDFDRVKSPEMMDGLFHFHVQVLRTAFGPIRRGKLEILLVTHAVPIAEGSTWNIYLRRARNDGWYIADCRSDPVR